MITSPAFSGKRYAVLGLARSGLATVDALLASGAQVTAWDRQEDARNKVAGRAELVDPLDLDLTGYAGVVVSPGVPLNTHPIADHAAKFGVPVIGDIELFAQARASLPPHRVVGITGTNGKSTTTALIAHILKTAGIPALAGGNIGVPILAHEALTPSDKGVGVYVLELSSYQIDLTQSLDCDVAVLLNITPDHLDRYESFEAYAESKNRLLEMQTVDQYALINWPAFEAGLIRPDKAGFNGIVAANESGQANWPSLQGPHNAENAGASMVSCARLGLSVEQIEHGLRTFPGLPHRMEIVGEHGGVLFINDSKATNQASAAPALAAYPPDDTINSGAPRVHWIVGGLAKEPGLQECGAQISNVAAAYTIGEAGPALADELDGRVHVERSELLCEAVKRAVGAARTGEIVLLSPACASFDQFRDFEQRGDHFRKIVEALTTGDETSAQRICEEMDA